MRNCNPSLEANREEGLVRLAIVLDCKVSELVQCPQVPRYSIDGLKELYHLAAAGKIVWKNGEIISPKEQ